MQSQTLFLLGVLFCVIVSVAGGGDHKSHGHKDHKNKKEKWSKCGGEPLVTEEWEKGKDECKPATEKKEKSEDEDEGSRRRRHAEGGNKKKKWGGKWGGKGWFKDMCTHVCMMKKQGTLDDATGNFNEAGAQEHCNKLYPEKFRADAFAKIKECATNHSSAFSMDDNCKGYRKFGKCLWHAHMKVCGFELGKWGKKKGGESPPAKATEQEGVEEE